MTSDELRAWAERQPGVFAAMLRRDGRTFDTEPLSLAYLGFGPAPGRCLDATRAVLRAKPALRPVVGYASPPKGQGEPLEHVWATDEQGRLVDVSWENAGSAYLGAVVPAWQLALLSARPS